MQTYSVGEAIVDEMFRKVQSDVGKGINAAMNKMHEKMDELEPLRPIHDRAEVEHARTIIQALPKLNEDELRGVARLVQKLLAGKEAHGPLVLATDKRDFRRERRAEGEDWLWYSIFEEICRE